MATSRSTWLSRRGSVKPTTYHLRFFVGFLSRSQCTCGYTLRALILDTPNSDIGECLAHRDLGKWILKPWVPVFQVIAKCKADGWRLRFLEDREGATAFYRSVSSIVHNNDKVVGYVENSASESWSGESLRG